MNTPLKILVAILIALMIAGIFAIDLVTAPVETPLRIKVASAIGYAAAPLLAAIVFLIFRRFRTGTAFLSIAFFAALLTAGLSLKDYQHNARDREQMRVMGRNLEKDVTRLMESQIGADGLTRPDTPLLDTRSSATGKYGELETYIRNHLNQMIELQNDYLTELKACGWETLLDPARLATDSNLTESRRITLKGLSLVGKYRDRMMGTFDDYVRGFDQLNVSESTKRRLRKEASAEIVKQKIDVQQRWALEQDIFEKADALIELLASRHGHWAVQRGQLVFDNDADIAKFKGLLKSIEDLSKQQQDMQRQAEQKAMAALKKLKD